MLPSVTVLPIISSFVTVTQETVQWRHVRNLEPSEHHDSCQGIRNTSKIVMYLKSNERCLDVPACLSPVASKVCFVLFTEIRKKESEMLENETAEMTERLATLRDQMLQEKAARDAQASQKVIFV